MNATNPAPKFETFPSPVCAFWEEMSNGHGKRLVREWVNSAGQVDRFEVVTVVWYGTR